LKSARANCEGIRVHGIDHGGLETSVPIAAAGVDFVGGRPCDDEVDLAVTIEIGRGNIEGLEAQGESGRAGREPASPSPSRMVRLKE
jgi:hypothetical protein